MTTHDKGQMPFSFDYQAAQSAGDFIVSPTNEQALLWLDRYPDWQAPGLIISGATAIGKTHLAHIWQSRTQAQYMQAADAIDQALEQPAQHLIIDQADIVVPLREQQVFHLYHRAVSEQKHILFCARQPVANWVLQLPDLSSRLLALPQVQILPPDDMLLMQLFAKLLAERGLTLKPDAVDYALNRLPRDAGAMAKVVQKLDHFALAHGKGLTLPIIRQFFSQATEA